MQKEVKDHILGIIEKAQENSAKWGRDLDLRNTPQSFKDFMCLKEGVKAFSQGLSEIRDYIRNNFSDI